jgi:hypothetical protein
MNLSLDIAACGSAKRRWQPVSVGCRGSVVFKVIRSPVRLPNAYLSGRCAGAAKPCSTSGVQRAAQSRGGQADVGVVPVSGLVRRAGACLVQSYHDAAATLSRVRKCHPYR